MFVQLPIALSLIQATPTNTTASNFFASMESYYSLVVVQTICVLCALRGIHAKHARSAGGIGLIAILVIGGAWILNGLAGCIFVGHYNPGQLPSQDTINQLLAFTQIDNYFIIAGDILLGISFIHGKVYPTWIGVAAIVLGGINIIGVLLQSQPSLATSSFAIFLLVVGTLIAIVQNTATGWVLFKKPAPTPIYRYP